MSGSDLGLFLWHWGKEGAGAKFSAELARGLTGVPGTTVSASAATDSDLMVALNGMSDLPVRPVRTFSGDKRTLGGKLAAGFALAGLPRIGFDFASAIRDFEPDVALCSFQSIWDAAALPVLRRARTRFILVLHDAEPHPGDRYLFRNAVLRREVSAADGLIVLSEHVAREATRLHGFPADRIGVVPHGAFSFDGTRTMPRSFPVGRPFRLLFFGRIVAYKGLSLLLDAVKVLAAQDVAIELSVVGSGDLSPYRAQMDGMPGLTVRNDWVDDAVIAAALDEADAVVLPYVEASQSGVAAAAFAAGLPVVATPVGGLVEQVADRETGLVAKAVDPLSLAASIRELASGPALYEACSNNALCHANTVLGWGAIAHKVRDFAAETAHRPRLRLGA